jgi:predicted GH43/DUF377 family glycosyl hydrolase
MAGPTGGIIVFLLVGSLILVGCSRGTPQPAESASASGSANPSGSEPSVTFAWPDGAEPTITRVDAGLDERYINPGAVIAHDGQLHMFANLFTAWPGRVRVQHLVSSDGATWTLGASQPVFDSEDVPFTDEGADVSTGFVAPDGTWVLIFETVSSSNPWVLGRATASAPEGPWTIDPEPLLEGGGDGSWDAGLAWPSVVPTADGYAMFYTAFDRIGGTGVIGRATSPDGMTWTKDEAPVLVAERDWERGSLDRPRVAITPSGMVMVYAGDDLTDRGVAWSADVGATWRRDGDRPAITQGDFPIEGRAWDAAIVVREGTLIYYLEIGTASGPEGTQVYRATAELPTAMP